MIQLLLGAHNYGDLAFLILRFALAAVFLAHGLGKRTMWRMSPSEEMPKKMLYVFRTLSIYEPLAAVALIGGFLTQIFAAGLSIVMLGAIYMKIFVWGKKFTGEDGWELDLIIIAALFSIVCFGAGAYGLDRLIFGL